MNTNNNLNIREKHAELPLFCYKSVSAATNNFLAMNKLGEEGYGPVYRVRYIFRMNLLWTLLRKSTLIVHLHESLKSLWFSFTGEITQWKGNYSENAIKKIWTGNWGVQKWDSTNCKSPA